MLLNIAAIIVTIAALALVILVIERYFPNLPILVRAVVLASIVLAVIRTLRMWICSWLCGGG